MKKILFLFLFFLLGLFQSCGLMSPCFGQWNKNIYDNGTISNDTITLISVSFQHYLNDGDTALCHIYGYTVSDSEEFAYCIFDSTANIFLIDTIITNYLGTTDAVSFPSDTGVAYVTVQYEYNYLDLLSMSGGGGGSGTVTSVGLSLPAILSVSGSPVTSSGTLSASLASQLQNLVFASPNGSSGTPTFRALVSNDIPSLTSLYEVPLTFSTGLTRSTNTITVNTSQNIAKLSNLTSNGFVVTSGGDGTLSIDGNTYITGNQTITLSGDISGSGTTAITTTIGNDKVLTANILNANVTLAKIANASANSKLLGSGASGSGNPYEEITLGTNLSMSGTTLNVTGGSGTVTSVDVSTNNGLSVSGNPITTSGTLNFGITNLSIADTSLAANSVTTAKINDAAVTLAKMANMATSSLIYRKTASSGAPEVNTLATLKSDLGLTGTNGGGANPSASLGLSAINGSATTFMRSDGAPAINQAIIPTWTGAHTWTLSTSATSGSTTILNIGVNSTGTTAATFGSQVQFKASSATVADRGLVTFLSVWDTATDASRTGHFRLGLGDPGGVHSGFEFTQSGYPTIAYQLNLNNSGSAFQINSTNVLTGTTLGSGVTGSSLTTFGSSPTIVTPSITTGFTIGGAAASGKFIVGNGTNFVASTSTIPTSAGSTAGKILISDATNYILSTPTYPNSAGTAGKIMQSDGTNEVMSAYTMPTSAGTANKIIKSDGTNLVTSTETYAAPGTSGNIMKSDGTNWTSTTNSGGWTIASVSGSNFTRTAQTLADITGLTFAATASTTYEIEATLMVTSSTTAGIQFAVATTGGGATPANSSCIVIGGAGNTSAAAAVSTSVTGNGTAAGAVVTSSTSQTTVKIWATVNSGTGNPTISIQCLKTTGGTATVLIGSTMKIRVLGT